jgi:multiple sugar transport system ATP-binding protein
MATLELRGIGKEYQPGVNILQDVDMTIADGEFVVFVGPSGCGKSTLLRMIAGLEDITSGDLLIDGQRANEIEPSRRGVAMVFQSYALYPHMTIAENMGFALKMAGKSAADVAAAVGRAAEILQLSHLLDRKPKALSGGQRQRVAIGRAIVRKPKVFLFDEPLSNLDASLRVTMRIELAKLHRELGTTMVYVTHDQVEAMTLGNRIAVFNHGKVEQMGRPLDLYERPDKQFVATFLGAPMMNLLPCSASAAAGSAALVDLGGGNTLQVPCAASMGANSSFMFGVRPEHVGISAVGEGIAAHVEFVEHLGDHRVIHTNLAHNQQRVSAKISMSERLDIDGDMVGLRFEATRCHLFTPEGVALPLHA